MENEAGKSNRICLYDNMRFVLICLVIVGHCVGQYREEVDAFRKLYVFIYSFHMPAFIFLAGLFHKDERIAPKTVSYLCIGFLMIAGFFLGNILANEIDPFRVFNEWNIAWFMYVLAGYTLVSYLLRDIDKRFLLLAAGVFGCFVGYDETVGSYLTLSRGFAFYPFYVLGQICSKEKAVKVSRRPLLRVIGIVFLIGWAAVCFCRKEPAYWQESGVFKGAPYADEFFLWGPVLRLLWYGISLMSVFSLMCAIPAKRLPVITTLGSRTLQIYFWHWPVVRMIDVVTGLGALLCSTGAGRIAWVVFGVAVAFVTGARLFCFPTEFILRWTGVRKKNHS